MNKKTLVLGLALASLCGAAHADSQLVVKTSTEQEDVFDLDKVQRITFSESQMNIYQKGVSYAISYSFDDIMKMFFVTETGDIEYIGEQPAHQLTIKDNKISISGLEKPADSFIFDLKGRVVASMPQWDGSTYNAQQLSKGVYVVVVGKQPYKFVKQ